LPTMSVRPSRSSTSEGLSGMYTSEEEDEDCPPVVRLDEEGEDRTRTAGPRCRWTPLSSSSSDEDPERWLARQGLSDMYTSEDEGEDWTPAAGPEEDGDWTLAAGPQRHVFWSSSSEEDPESLPPQQGRDAKRIDRKGEIQQGADKDQKSEKGEKRRKKTNDPKDHIEKPFLQDHIEKPKVGLPTLELWTIGLRGGAHLRKQMLNAQPINLDDPMILAVLMTQLIAGQEDSVSYSTIIPNLHLGRASDTVNMGYDLLVCAANGARELEESLKSSSLERLQLPILVNGKDVSSEAYLHMDKEVGPESFPYDGQQPLCKVLSRMEAVLSQGGKVFVCCQQGKDRSALVVLAYLRAKFGVPQERLDNLYNFVQSKRYIVSAREIPQYWNFIKHEFNVTLAQEMMAAEHP